MTRKGYYVRDTHGFYLGRRPLNSPHPRPWVEDPERAAVFTKTEADALVAMGKHPEPDGPQPYAEKVV